jgi:hypothetical protein
LENQIQVLVTVKEHCIFAEKICVLLEESARLRGTGIGKRNPSQIRSKIENGDAIIALCGDEIAAFCYVQTWENGRFASHSGLIVVPKFRKHGLATKVKEAAFLLVRQKYPKAKIFGITTSLAVMKINTELGYVPVTFSELPQDENFWAQCQGCKNYDILLRNEQKMCLCTGMLAASHEDTMMKVDLSHQILNQNTNTTTTIYEQPTENYPRIQWRLRHFFLRKISQRRTRL